MQITINLNDVSEAKKDWLLYTLALSGVPFTSDDRQTLEQFNQELEDSENEYQKGDYISHTEMIKKAAQWK